jgi:hypothetical protein
VFGKCFSLHTYPSLCRFGLARRSVVERCLLTCGFYAVAARQIFNSWYVLVDSLDGLRSGWYGTNCVMLFISLALSRAGVCFDGASLVSVAEVTDLDGMSMIVDECMM